MPTRRRRSRPVRRRRPFPNLADPHALLLSREAALVLRCTTDCLEHWRARGTGPAYVRLGSGRVRYYLADLRAWLDARRVRPTSEVRA